MNNRDFTAPYVFHEYPKWVTLADGSKALANNSDEERILIGQHDDDQDQPVIEPTPATPVVGKPATSRRRGNAGQADETQE